MVVISRIIPNVGVYFGARVPKTQTDQSKTLMKESPF